MNNGYSKFTSFGTFLENAGLVPRSQDAVFLCGSSLTIGNDAYPTISNFIPAYPIEDQTSNLKSKSTYSIGQTLQLTRDGYCKNVLLNSVDIDIDTLVPYSGFRLSNGLTTSVTK